MLIKQDLDYKDMKLKKYIIFNVQELPKVDFSVVCEESQYTIRKSVNGTKTFVKWNTEIEPWFLDLLETKEGPYTMEEISNILLTDEWKPPSPYV
jgi:hypothetical protein